MPAGPRELEQLGDLGLTVDDDRLPWAAPAHGHDDHLAIPRQQARDVPCDRCLADALARPDDSERRKVEGLEADGVEPEVGAHIGNAASQGPARQAEAPGRIGHGLVGEVDDDLGGNGLERLFQCLENRNPVVLSAAQLLRPTEKDGPDDVVLEARERDPDDIGIVLPVDQRQGPQGLLVTSPSMRLVYFSNSSVSAEN